jgi:hypothetical protein
MDDGPPVCPLCVTLFSILPVPEFLSPGSGHCAQSFLEIDEIAAAKLRHVHWIAKKLRREAGGGKKRFVELGVSRYSDSSYNGQSREKRK